MDREGWRALIPRVAKSWTQPKRLSTCTQTVSSTEHMSLTQSVWRACDFISIYTLHLTRLCLWLLSARSQSQALRFWSPSEDFFCLDSRQDLKNSPQKGSLSLGLRKPLCSQWKVEWFPLTPNISGQWLFRAFVNWQPSCLVQAWRKCPPDSLQVLWKMSSLPIVLVIDDWREKGSV